MKKLLAWMLAAVMCLSLVGSVWGSGEAEPETEINADTTIEGETDDIAELEETLTEDQSEDADSPEAEEGAEVVSEEPSENQPAVLGAVEPAQEVEDAAEVVEPATDGAPTGPVKYDYPLPGGAEKRLAKITETYILDFGGDPLTVTNVYGFEYDNNGQIIYERIGLGYSFSYDCYGHLTQRIMGSAGGNYEYRYDNSGNLVYEKSSLMGYDEHEYSYNSDGYLISMIKTFAYSYSSKDEGKITTEFSHEYNSDGSLIYTGDGDVPYIITYDSEGHLTSKGCVSDPNYFAYREKPVFFKNYLDTPCFSICDCYGPQTNYYYLRTMCLFYDTAGNVVTELTIGHVDETASGGTVSSDYDYNRLKSPTQLTFDEDGYLISAAYTNINGSTKTPYTYTFTYEDNPLYEAEPFTHVIYSSGDNGIDRYFQFNENEEVEDLVLSTSSTTYNPRLAHMLCVMARAAYNHDLVKKNLEELGFFIENEFISGTDYYEDYKDDMTVAYSLAKKKLSDGSTFVMITIRGTTDWSLSGDGMTNADIGIAALNGFGKHEGFEREATDIYNSLRNLLGGIPTSNVTYVITGHSQGAGVGNLLAVKLYDNGVPTSRVYDYNFACPNVACLLNPNDWNPDGIHDNIFNIGNVLDPVPFLPSNLIKMFIPRLVPLSTWGKFGRSYWFSPDDLNHATKDGGVGHDMIYYDNELMHENPLSSFIEYWQISGEWIMRVLGIHCPVDISVYDGSGTLVAEVVDNEAYYYNAEPGEVIIFIDGDEKYICLSRTRDYDIRFIATDDGELMYEVYDADIASESIQKERAYNAVQLSVDKTMSSTVSGSIATEDVRLVTVDETGAPVAMIQTDGTEAIFGDADINGIVDATDATLMLQHIVGLTDAAAGYSITDATALLAGLG